MLMAVENLVVLYWHGRIHVERAANAFVVFGAGGARSVLIITVRIDDFELTPLLENGLLEITLRGALRGTGLILV
jgi:hypothetical protein